MARPVFRLPDTHAADDLLAKLFRGLGDRTRIRLLDELAGADELSVAELCTRIGAPQPKVSTHLAALRWCGFVASRRDHPQVLNRLPDERVLELLATARGVLADQDRLPPPAADLDALYALGEPAAPPAELPEPHAAPGLHLVFELGDEACALPVRQVRETLVYREPRRVPAAPPGLLGLLDVRGEIQRVHDLAEAIGHRPGPYAWLVRAVDRWGRGALLAVGAVRGVEELAAGDLRPAPGHGTGVAALAVRERGLALVLDADALVGRLVSR